MADVTPTGSTGDVLSRLRAKVTAALTDATRNNPLIYYRSATTGFDTPDLGSDFVTKLLDKSPLRREDFGPHETAPKAGPTVDVAPAADGKVGPPVDAL
ncbi:MAG: hypothetical protein ABR508_11290 [Candidatus Baltobacteraceae bacterium]